MKNLALAALAGLMLTTGAKAQTADQTPIRVTTFFQPPATPTHDASSYVDGNWTVPTPEQINAAWPPRAQMDDIEGRVTLDCSIAPNGRLASVDIIDESPRGYGADSGMIAPTVPT